MARSIMEQSLFFNRVRRLLSTFTTREDPITALMKHRARMIARGEYEPLGKVLMVQTLSGWIQFQTGRGPALGVTVTGDIEFLDAWEWEGLPDRYEQKETLCPDCEKVPCNECNDGWRICSYGTQTDCCGGSGKIVAQNDKACPKCLGTGNVRCRKCAGSGMMTTGRPRDIADIPLCPTCDGSGRGRETIRQDLLRHLSDKLVQSLPDPYIALGPVLAVMLTPADNGPTQAWQASIDLEGYYPHFVSSFERGQRIIIFRGCLQQTNLKKRKP